MNKNAIKKRRIKAVKAVLQKPLSQDMKAYWTGVLKHLSSWSVEKRNMGLNEMNKAVSDE